MSLLSLPVELVVLLSKYLRDEDLVTLMDACEQLRVILTMHDVWKFRLPYRSLWGNDPEKLIRNVLVARAHPHMRELVLDDSDHWYEAEEELWVTLTEACRNHPTIKGLTINTSLWQVPDWVLSELMGLFVCVDVLPCQEQVGPPMTSKFKAMLEGVGLQTSRARHLSWTPILDPLAEDENPDGVDFSAELKQATRTLMKFELEQEVLSEPAMQKFREDLIVLGSQRVRSEEGSQCEHCGTVFSLEPVEGLG